MLKEFHRSVVVLFAVAILGLIVGKAAAETVIYDFDQNVGETLVAGPLVGQDNWENKHTTGTHVVVGSGHENFSGNYAYGPTSSADSSDVLFRPNNANWSFALQDDLDFSVSAVFQTYADDSNITSQFGLDYDRGAGWNNWILFGIYNGEMTWRVREGDGSSYNDLFVETMDVPASNDPVAHEIGVEASAKMNKAYDFKLFYRDVTNGGDKMYFNNGEVFSVTFTNNLSTMFDMLYLRSTDSSSYNATIVDDIRISQVPEPSTLALLTAGLVGLLAYAWRKRK